MGGIITTVSGTRLDVRGSPRLESIRINDIAHGLSMQCRYNGQIETFYNVADHCIAVANAVFKVSKDYRKALEGLLHDAHEAYIGDMARPIKQHFADTGQYGFDFMEHLLAGSIMLKYGLPEVVTKTEAGVLYTPSEEIKDMDRAAYQHESFCLHRKSGDNLKLPSLFTDITQSNPNVSKKSFLKYFRFLQEKLDASR